MKWRKEKKKFKKTKKKLIGSIICVNSDIYGVVVRIKDIHIHPAGGKKAEFSFFCEPVETPAKEPDELYTHGEVHINENGYNFSYDIPNKDILEKAFGL